MHTFISISYWDSNPQPWHWNNTAISIQCYSCKLSVALVHCISVLPCHVMYCHDMHCGAGLHFLCTSYLHEPGNCDVLCFVFMLILPSLHPPLPPCPPILEKPLRLTIADLPNGTAVAGRCSSTHGPLAGAVLHQSVAIAETPQAVQFAHAQ